MCFSHVQNKGREKKATPFFSQPKNGKCLRRGQSKHSKYNYFPKNIWQTLTYLFNTVWAGCPVTSSDTNFRHIAAFITSIGLAYDVKRPMINLKISIGNTNYEWWKIMPKTIYLQELESKVPAINSDWCMTPDCFKIVSSLCVKVNLWLTKHFWFSFILCVKATSSTGMTYKVNKMSHTRETRTVMKKCSSINCSEVNE